MILTTTNYHLYYIIKPLNSLLYTVKSSYDPVPKKMYNKTGNKVSTLRIIIGYIKEIK